MAEVSFLLSANSRKRASASREKVLQKCREKAARGNADLCKLMPSLNFYFSI